MIDREKLLTEIKFRKFVRELLEEKDKKESFKEKMQEEVKFRNFIRQVLTKERETQKLQEAKTKIIPYDSTGIAILADVIKKIIPIIKDDYFSLTTDIVQRKSFRAHIVNAVRNSLAPIRNIQGYPVDASGGDGQLLSAPDMSHPKHHYAQSGNGANGPHDTGPMMEADFGDVDSSELEDIDNDGIADKDDREIEIDDKPAKKVKSSEDEDTFSLPGEDGTGRNLALLTYRRIEKVIIDGYQTLDRREDQEDFYDYIVANLKIYFDRWEEELQKELNERF